MQTKAIYTRKRKVYAIPKTTSNAQTDMAVRAHIGPGYRQYLLFATPAACRFGEFCRSTTPLGFLVTLTQIGYACGMLLIIPLGDALNRRKMIISLLLVTGVVLLAVAG